MNDRSASPATRFSSGGDAGQRLEKIIEVVSLCNVLLLLPLGMTHSEGAHALGALGSLLMLPKMAGVARGDERLSHLISLLKEVLIDIRPFLGLMMIVILANAFAFELLSAPNSEYSGPFSAWMAAYSLTIGEFDPHTYQDSALKAFFFHYFTIFVNIVLLNVLIAIISDTYGRVDEKRAARSLLQRARLLQEIESRIPARELANPVLFPVWLHVLKREDKDLSEETHFGRFDAIQKSLDRLHQRQADLETKLETKLEAVLARSLGRLTAGSAPVRGRAAAPTLSSRQPSARQPAVTLGRADSSMQGAGIATALVDPASAQEAGQRGMLPRFSRSFKRQPQPAASQALSA